MAFGGAYEKPNYFRRCRNLVFMVGGFYVALKMKPSCPHRRLRSPQRRAKAKPADPTSPRQLRPIPMQSAFETLKKTSESMMSLERSAASPRASGGRSANSKAARREDELAAEREAHSIATHALNSRVLFTQFQQRLQNGGSASQMEQLQKEAVVL